MGLEVGLFIANAVAKDDLPASISKEMLERLGAEKDQTQQEIQGGVGARKTSNYPDSDVPT